MNIRLPPHQILLVLLDLAFDIGRLGGQHQLLPDDVALHSKFLEN